MYLHPFRLFPDRLLRGSGVLLCLALSAVEAPGAEIDELYIALRPSKVQASHIESFKPIADRLARDIGMPVNVSVASDYRSVINALANGEVQVAFLGPYSYVLAHDAAAGGVEPLVVPVRQSARRRNIYNSIIVAGGHTQVRDPSQFNESHLFAFPDPASTSGYLVPFHQLISLGVDPAQFQALHMAGSHAAALLAVQKQGVHGAASNMQTYETLLELGLIDIQQVRIVWKSPDLPLGPVAVPKDLPGDLKFRLLKSFLAMPAGLGGIDGTIARFVPVADKDYDPIRKIRKELALRRP